ncbi:Nascent polypeptide-associated complex subunit alpha [Dirofilaria immitis]
MSKPDERFVCQNRFGPPKKLCWFIPICKNPQAIIVLSPTMTKCKCGCHEGKQCTCKECPDKSEGKEKCSGSCHGTDTHQGEGHGDAKLGKCCTEGSNKHCHSEK